MSTVEVAPNVEGSEVAASNGLIKENSSYKLIKDTKGEIKPFPEDKANELIEKEGAVEVLSQSFAFYRAATIEGAQSLVPDTEEFLNLFNRGLVVKQQNKARQIINERGENDEPIFTATEEAYDMREVCAEPTQRRGLSPVEKAKKVLMGLSEEQRNALLALMAG
jgi:hypothetical protein